MSSLTVEEDQKWIPTHVQVTVLRGRGLRGKGKHGTSDVYTIIQLGKEKYSTGVVEKTTEPEWREECTFELQPGVLESGGRSSSSAGSKELVLTVMHRALMGLDVFLGQAVIPLDKVFHESRCVKNDPLCPAAQFVLRYKHSCQVSGAASGPCRHTLPPPTDTKLTLSTSDPFTPH